MGYCNATMHIYHELLPARVFAGMDQMMSRCGTDLDSIDHIAMRTNYARLSCRVLCEFSVR